MPVRHEVWIKSLAKHTQSERWKEEERKIEKQKMNMKVAKTTKRHHKEFAKEAGN